MNAVPRERPMIEDHRIIKLEADVAHLCIDMSEARQDIRELQMSVADLRTDVHDFRIEVAREIGSQRTEGATRFGSVDSQFGMLRTETATRFGEVDVKIESLRTDMATRFGVVDVKIEAVKTLVERSTRYVMVFGLTTLGTLIAMFGTIGHALKWF